MLWLGTHSLDQIRFANFPQFCGSWGIPESFAEELDGLRFQKFGISFGQNKVCELVCESELSVLEVNRWKWIIESQAGVDFSVGGFSGESRVGVKKDGNFNPFNHFTFKIGISGNQISGLEVIPASNKKRMRFQ